MTKKQWISIAIAIGAVGLCTAAAGEPEGGSGHEDIFAPVLLELALVVILAMIGRGVAIRFKQPPVLGELLAGVIVSNIGYHIFHARFFSLVMHLTDFQKVFQEVWSTTKPVFEIVQALFAGQADSAANMTRLLGVLNGDGASEMILLGMALWIFSNFGVILLLFVVGYEMRIGDLIKVGPRATVVAVVGVVTPFVLGFAGSAFMLSHLDHTTHIFMGAILCATSVGITARVFRDLNRLATPEATMILGAAVIDDVLGLIILAVVAGIVASGHIAFLEIAKITAYSLMFLGFAMLIGENVVGWVIRKLNRLPGRDLKLLFPLSLAFLLAWAASMIGLAPIVGAFTAGLIFSEDLFRRHPEKRAAIEWISPLEAIFAPIFFVLMGMQVDLVAFAQPSIIGIAVIFIIAAVVGKLVCGLVSGPTVDALTIGIGMIPRGEVGLIFANIGKTANVLSGASYSGIVIVVVVTTLITPIGLKWAMARSDRRRKT